MKTYDLKGYTLVLSQVVFVTAVFEADNKQGTQFNVRLSSDILKFRFPLRTEAVMARELLIKAIKEA